MKWIDVRISPTCARVRCPKCRALFTLPLYSLRGDERRRWKRCPICETKIDRYTPRELRPSKPTAAEAGQGGTP